MASSESLFVIFLGTAGSEGGEISNYWAKDIAGGGRGFGYGTEITRLAGQLFSSVFSPCSVLSAENYYFLDL